MSHKIGIGSGCGSHMGLIGSKKYAVWVSWYLGGWVSDLSSDVLFDLISSVTVLLLVIAFRGIQILLKALFRPSSCA